MYLILTLLSICTQYMDNKVTGALVNLSPDRQIKNKYYENFIQRYFIIADVHESISDIGGSDESS